MRPPHIKSAHIVISKLQETSRNTCIAYMYSECMTNKIHCVMLTYVEGLPMVTLSVVSSHSERTHTYTHTRVRKVSSAFILSPCLT